MSIIERLNNITGVDCVFNSPDVLDAYSKDESFVASMRPQCVVKPSGMEEVREIVQWANETKTPIVPVSSGPPRFRGDTVPELDGSVIIDLSGMNKIIRVDRRNRLAMVEPGVTFGDLIPKLEKEGLAPMMPFLPRATKSVLTSALEREPIITPRHHWENLDPLCCTEVVYGSGDLFRTGSAAGPGTVEEQWKVGGAQIFAEGPSQTDFVRIIQGAEGTIGIVTWATVTCRILPKAGKYFFITAEKIEPLVDAVYKLLWKKLGERCLIINNQTAACILSDDKEHAGKLRAQLPSFILFFSLEAGGLLPKDKIEYQEEEMVEVLRSLGLEAKQELSSITAERVGDLLSRPSKDPFWKTNIKGGWEDILFLTTLDRVPQFTSRMSDLCKEYGYPEEELGIYIQPTVQGSNCHCEFGLSYAPDSGEELDVIKNLITKGAKKLSEAGAFFSRPYGPWRDFAYEPSPETVDAFKKVKSIWDPNNILNPGKLCF